MLNLCINARDALAGRDGRRVELARQRLVLRLVDGPARLEGAAAVLHKPAPDQDLLDVLASVAR